MFLFLSTEIRKNRGKKKEDEDCFVVSIKTLFCFLFVFCFFKRKWDEKLKTSEHAVCLCCQMEEIEISPRLWESGITLSAEDCGATDHCTSSSCEICFLIASCFCCPPHFFVFLLVHSSFLSLSSPRNIFQLLMNHIGSNMTHGTFLWLFPIWYRVDVSEKVC